MNQPIQIREGETEEIAALRDRNERRGRLLTTMKDSRSLTPNGPVRGFMNAVIKLLEDDLADASPRLTAYRAPAHSDS